MHDTNINPDISGASAFGGGPVSKDTSAPVSEKPAPGSEDAADLFLPGENTPALFRPSETMRLELTNLLKYCALAGIDAEEILSDMKKEGLLPAADRKGGKKALAAFRSSVLRQVME